VSAGAEFTLHLRHKRNKTCYNCFCSVFYWCYKSVEWVNISQLR